MSSDVKRKSRARHRQRREDDDDEDYEGGGFGGWKLGLVIGVIVVCFAVVYPHVFHPLILSFLGKSDSAPSARNDRPPMHPGMAGRGPAGSRGPGGGGAGDHPAMRMAAAQAEAQGSKGGARSIYTFMIPIYTVGVIAFLLYTMFKSKKKNKRRRRGSDDEFSDEDEDVDTRGGRKPLAGRKMRDLQERLRQTEDAMSKILTQLEKAQTEGKLTPEMMSNLGAEKTKEEEQKKKPAPAAKGSKKSAKKEEKADKTLDNIAKQLPDQETTQYMEDLEKALADFKQLSDLYEDAKGGKRRRQASESEEESESELSSEDVDEEEEEEEEDNENSKASSSHPFPKEDQEEEEEEPVQVEEIDNDDDAVEEEEAKPESEEEEPEREPTPPPQPSKNEKVRRRKPQKI